MWSEKCESSEEACASSWQEVNILKIERAKKINNRNKIKPHNSVISMQNRHCSKLANKQIRYSSTLLYKSEK